MQGNTACLDFADDEILGLAKDVQRYARRHLPSDVWNRYGEDIAAESFVRLLKASRSGLFVIPSYSDERAVIVATRQFLFGIVRNLLREILRESRNATTGIEVFESVASTSVPDTNREDDRFLIDAVKAICTKREWEIIEMVAGKFSAREIGGILGATSACIEAIIRRMRARIRLTTTNDPSFSEFAAHRPLARSDSNSRRVRSSKARRMSAVVDG